MSPAVTEARAPEAASSAAGVRLAWDNEEPSERVAESLLLLFLFVVIVVVSDFSHTSACQNFRVSYWSSKPFEIQNVDEFRVIFDEILGRFGWKMI